MKAVILFALGTAALFGQAQPTQAQQKQPPAPMTFFITSVGGGDGANLGGLAGAGCRPTPERARGRRAPAARAARSSRRG